MQDERNQRLGKRRVQRWSIAAAMLLSIWLLGSTLVAYRLTRRPRARFPEPAPRVSWASIEDLRLRTLDGQDLGAWFVEGAHESPSVLVLHGNKGSRANSITRAEFLASAGYSALLISLRAHGDSTGDRNDFGYSARNDVLAAVEYLEQRRQGRPIVVLGTSLGSAAAAFASEALGGRVRGYILESPYKDLKTAVWNRTDTYLPPVLSSIAYAGLRLVGSVFLPELDRIAPCQAIEGIPDEVPVLIIAGAVDSLARPDEARSLLARVADHGKLVLFPNAGHNNLFNSDPGRYKEVVLGFCEEIRAASRSR
jgi:alpha-beta hydrolase superfamily lysophospholipase